MVKHCSICICPATRGAPLCDRCAAHLRRECKLAHLAIAAGACVGGGAIRNLRRDEERLAEYDEWKAQEMSEYFEEWQPEGAHGGTWTQEPMAHSQHGSPALKEAQEEANARPE